MVAIVFGRELGLKAQNCDFRQLFRCRDPAGPLSANVRAFPDRIPPDSAGDALNHYRGTFDTSGFTESMSKIVRAAGVIPESGGQRLSRKSDRTPCSGRSLLAEVDYATRSSASPQIETD